MTLSQRFCQFIKYGKPGQCWRWTRPPDNRGYGRISVRGRNMLAHRVAYVIAHRTRIPRGLCVLHTCDQPLCVNPAHLVLGTKADNSHDMIRKGRAVHVNGEQHGRAKLTWQQVQAIRQLAALVSQYQVAELYGISSSQVSNIVQGRQWRSAPMAMV